jgi:hypothetical protein
MRDDDLVAEKFENMLLESLRNLGEAGDSGGLRNGGFGDANSAPLKLPGDLGLLGLMGPPSAQSLAALPLKVSDSVEDLGILRSCFRGASVKVFDRTSSMSG